MPSFADNAAYVQYESLLLELHRLIADGEGESIAANRIREKMDGYVGKLSAPEAARLDGLAADLYMLTGNELTARSAVSEMSADQFRSELEEARKWNDWEWVLDLLRHRPPVVPILVAALVRSNAYRKLGHPRPALLFLEFFAHHMPHEWGAQALRLGLLKDAGEHDEARKAAMDCLTREDCLPEVRVAAADVLLDLREDGNTVELAARALERTLRSGQHLIRSYAVLGWILLAGCHQKLGNPGEGVASFEEALRFAPGDVTIIRARESLRALISVQGEAASSPATTDAVRSALERARSAADELGSFVRPAA